MQGAKMKGRPRKYNYKYVIQSRYKTGTWEDEAEYSDKLEANKDLKEYRLIRGDKKTFYRLITIKELK